MASKSGFLSNKQLDNEWGTTAYTAPATFYLALLTALPAPSATGSTISEVAYTSYARASFTKTSLAAASGQAVANTAQIAFPTCGATGATAVAVAVCDASSGGNMLRYWALPQSMVISSGITPTFPIGAITFTDG